MSEQEVVLSEAGALTILDFLMECETEAWGADESVYTRLAESWTLREADHRILLYEICRRRATEIRGLDRPYALILTGLVEFFADRPSFRPEWQALGARLIHA